MRKSQKRKGLKNIMKQEVIAPWLIVGAGILWGTMGIFVRHMEAMGLTTLQISAIRLTVAAIVFLIGLEVSRREKRRVEKKDFGWFALTGIVSIFLMSVSYFSAITLSSMASAAILLYTAPFFVLITSVAFFGEKMTVTKGIALLTAFTGCALVTGTGEASALGIVMGLLSGISYASYSIFGTVLLKKYTPLTVTAYAFLFASAGALLFCNVPDMVSKLITSGSVSTYLWCIGMGVITAAAPFALYTAGLQNTPAGKAAILAFVEPMVAALLGTAVFQEPLGLTGSFGIILILSAVFLLNGKNTGRAD